MQDLVRVGVADAAEEVRIGERALERVVLARQRVAKRVERRVERLEAAGIERASAAAPRTRCSDARFFEPASVKNSVPCSKSNAARTSFGPDAELLARLAPAQPAGDHQVDHEDSTSVVERPERDRNALADARTW